MKKVAIAAALAASACMNVAEDPGGQTASSTDVERQYEADASVPTEAERGDVEQKRFTDPNGGPSKVEKCTVEEDANYRCTTCIVYTDGVAGSPWTTCRPKPKRAPRSN